MITPPTTFNHAHESDTAMWGQENSDEYELNKRQRKLSRKIPRLPIKKCLKTKNIYIFLKKITVASFFIRIWKSLYQNFQKSTFNYSVYKNLGWVKIKDLKNWPKNQNLDYIWSILRFLILTQQRLLSTEWKNLLL